MRTIKIGALPRRISDTRPLCNLNYTNRPESKIDDKENEAAERLTGLNDWSLQVGAGDIEVHGMECRNTICKVTYSKIENMESQDGSDDNFELVDKLAVAT